MDTLSIEKQENIKRMSTERLIAYLIRAGSDEETVLTMDRSQLLEAWAELVAAGRDKPLQSSVLAEDVTTGYAKHCEIRYRSSEANV